jgi:hypothetical protein
MHSKHEGEESENNNSAIKCVKEPIFIHQNVAAKEGGTRGGRRSFVESMKPLYGQYGALRLRCPSLLGFQSYLSTLRTPDDVDLLPSTYRHFQLHGLFDKDLSGSLQSAGNWKIDSGPSLEGSANI